MGVWGKGILDNKVERCRVSIGVVEVTEDFVDKFLFLKRGYGLHNFWLLCLMLR
jgi:hypothetical protein